MSGELSESKRNVDFSNLLPYVRGCIGNDVGTAMTETNNVTRYELLERMLYFHCHIEIFRSQIDGGFVKLRCVKF